jgi:hypothetical protein
MKKATKTTGQAAEQTVENANCAIGLSQDTANVVLDGVVNTVEFADSYFRNVIKVGLDAQEASVNIARNYFDGMAKINRGWISLFAQTGESTINSVGDTVKKPVNDAIAAGAEIVANASAKARQAAK